MKVFLHLALIIFPFRHKIFYVTSHLSLVNWTFLADDICFQILVYILLWIQFRAIQGKEVKRYKVDNTFNSLELDARDLPGGTYLYQLISGSNSSSAKKMVVIK